MNQRLHRKAADFGLTPMLIVGAGPLISRLWKFGSEESGWRYRFEVHSETADGDYQTDLFQPSDLCHFLQLTHLLATEILCDGCITQADREALSRIVSQMTRNIMHQGRQDNLQAQSQTNRVSAEP